MKFGIFYELQLPRPWVAGDELKLYQNALSQMEHADRLGYDHAWVVEHHFLEEYSHSPSPESFLAAASQRTKTSGSATASSSSPPIIRRASPSASRCSTCSPTAAANSAWVRAPPSPS
ncbi:hypothetical protein BJ6T_23770 [Bradyrhizobium japonicum USDA 6]|nr:hypothetical protein BJ6T_23770 [Bradyrhizobium japonicum USDA 6]